MNHGAGAAWLGPFCALLSSVTWAFGTAGYSQIAKRNSAVAINFSRCLVAFPVFLIFVLIAAAWEKQTWWAGLEAFNVVEPRHFGWFTLSMFASYAVGDSLFLVSSRMIGVPAALTIASSYPLVTAAWGAIFQGEWLSYSQCIGLGLTVGGVALVILSAPRAPSQALPQDQAQDQLPERGNVQAEPARTQDRVEAARTPRTRGVILAFCAMACWALNSYAVTRGGQGIPTPVGNAVRMGIALILCAIVGKVTAPGARFWLSIEEYRKWMWLFVLEGVGGSCFFLYGLAHSPLAIGSALTSLAPVLSVPVALGLGLERFSWKRTAGVITVVFGLFLLVGGLQS